MQPLGATPARSHPTMITPHLINGAPRDAADERFELSDHIKRRLSMARAGPKAAFIVSMATMPVAPLIGVLLLIYNFMGGARLRQTALLACLTALLTLTSELATQSDANAIVNGAPEQNEPPHVAHL